MECKAKIPSRINVRPSQSHVKYDFTKTKAQLNSVDVDTISPYGPQHKTSVSGLMSGSIQLKNNISFLHETHSLTQQSCIFVKTIDVEINLDPTIFVASEFPKGSCMHSAILAHEFKHVEVDQKLVNRYHNLIGRALSDVLDARGGTYGPVHKNDLESELNLIKHSFHDVLIRLNDNLNQERRRQQQAIDTIEEYDSIGVRCKDRHRHSHRHR